MQRRARSDRCSAVAVLLAVMCLLAAYLSLFYGAL